MELFSLLVTLGLYLFFMTVYRRYKKAWLNPLLLSAISIILILFISNTSYESYHEGVKFITLLLGPATVSLAVPLYENKRLISIYYRQIFVAILAGVLTHAVSLIILKVTLDFSYALFVTAIPKSVTTAIAKDISAQSGGMVEITIALVIVTGVFGAIISEFVFKKLNIRSSISKGLALGVAAHAVGTSKAVELGQIEACMATIALILTGIITVLISPLILLVLS